MPMWIVVVIVAVFAWLAVVSWADARGKEREAFYRSETLRRVVESAGGSGAAVEFLREEERIAKAKMREGLKLVGAMSILGAPASASFCG